jgi:hypothetical protein
MQILEGKTNAGKIVWGRVMHHKHVNMCSIGALGFYLMARFDMTGEKFDFSDNSKWFNRKLLVSSTHSKNFDKEISYQHYPTVLRSICLVLLIIIEKYFYFDRYYGNMDGELNGNLNSSKLENLGNWMLTQREECYSTKLSLRPIRVMAKQPERKGGYLCPRGTVVTPMELQKMVFTFVKDAKVHMAQLIAEGIYRSTAVGFIAMLEHTRVVIPQDAAEMIINGRTHYLFLNPIFSCKLFKDYVKVTTVSLDTIHGTEKTVDVFSD